MSSWRRASFLALVGLVLIVAQSSRGADAGPDPKDVQAISSKAIAYLRQAQAGDGSWTAKRAGPGITAVVVAGLLRSGLGPDDPTVAKGLQYLEKSVQKDGGIYSKEVPLNNYTT